MDATTTTQQESPSTVTRILLVEDDPAVREIDLNMPPPDGWAVLSAMRVMQPDVPVVIASGSVAAADVAERGGAALLPKPYDRDQLLTVVAGLLG